MMKCLHIVKSIKTAMAISAVCLFPIHFAHGQGGCIEITSILVDACGTPEGENEMVRFDVGSAPLNVSNMTVDWPNNTWQGLCQDPGTAATVAAINQNIQGCGSVVEPVGGVLPANAKVLLLTSTNINIIANTFANLNEDLYLLFQCSGNTSGHFANYNVLPGLRGLSIGFTGICSDTVTYDRTLLVNQFGAIGGFSFENDGAFVEFNAAGNPTYLNYGCQVLSNGLALTGGPDVGLCPGGTTTAALNGSAVNLVGSPQWAGGTGTFAPNNTLTTVYTPGPGETGIVFLTLTGNGTCNASIIDTVRVNIVTSLPTVTISSSVTGTFNSNITDSTYFYNWYPDGSTTFIQGAFSPDFTPNANGCYFMQLSTVGGCFVQSNTLCITNVGLVEYSDGVSLNFVNNPGSQPSIKVETLVATGKLNLEVIDLFGRTIRSMDVFPVNSSIELFPDWSGVAAGMYLVRLSNNAWSAEGKVILSK
ncbi:MAG: T9SS type A sorting domain-containing protein [Bacteroidetes bacterium]|nr:T9SS type A sorting domain-containing protein [Bacteroidota bacterium]